MNHTKKIILAIGLLAAGVSFAQTTATTTRTSTANGLLGHRYTELSYGLDDIEQSGHHGYSVGARANNPILPGMLDAGAAYSYSWINGPFKGHANTVGAYATAYQPLAGVKPFATAALGYQWTSLAFGAGDDEAVWGAAIGVEVPVGAFTVTPRLSYSDDFNGTPRSNEAWTVSVEANYWFSATSAVYGSIGHIDVRRSSIDAWTYEIGLRARF